MPRMLAKLKPAGAEKRTAPTIPLSGLNQRQYRVDVPFSV